MYSNKVKGIFVLALIVAMTIPVFAATSGVISISGSVGGICDLTVTQPVGNNSLAITTKVTNLTIATFVEKCNKASGYTVSLSSANNWILTAGLLGNPDSLAYTLAYGGAAVDLSASTAVLTNSDTSTPGSGLTRILAISFDGAGAFLREDSYSDTLTFTIAAK